ncbi:MULTISPECIES: hypothetical protein [Testudinibacter]|uniref:Uncharacterized protein n=1 Tax=Testudinibacter aquarius TaxID=1524974 RepID=A0A4R3Y047_9PAST|nr:MULTISPECIES: hypothetical protein [Testudinibacter]TNG94408.1 hypothetical protein FHQ19_07585 [Pasteurellaceae bacterium UScroc12]TNG96005.1 hypothetical protein FHQ20_05680 [Pasteurellaceae bacterium USgator41]TNG98603.1 hypothetical protein FHQ24_08115 [Pasteurellaceae bacterium UScroc31]TNG99982.1 hypothetical protein FHQ28_08880 [Pasteurellaceae bacterium USgator11]TNH07033.1 hypothetical protein FHQ30_05580 [Pasteurellaceae bacterium Phil11]
MTLSVKPIPIQATTKQDYLAQIQSVEMQRIKLRALIEQAEESRFEQWENMEADLDAIFHE